MKLKNIVVATEKKGYYHVLEQSCKRHNIELIPLGMGEEWTGFTKKFELWRDYLNTLDDNEIVMINDAYDVVILEDGDTIIKKFKSFNKNIVICTQIKSYFTELVFDKCKNFDSVISIGSMIGYVKYLKQLIKLLFKYPNLWKKYKNDDQMIIQEVCNYENTFFKNNIVLDTNQKLFFATTGSDYVYNMIFKNIINLYMKNNKLYTDNNITPSVLHLAGNVDGNVYLQYLNYKNLPTMNMWVINPYKTTQMTVFLKILVLHKTIPLIFTSISIITYLYFFKINIQNTILFILIYIFIWLLWINTYSCYSIIINISIQYLFSFIK